MKGSAQGNILNRIEEIRSMLDVYENSPTECDGRTRIFQTILTKEKVSHRCMVGACKYKDQQIGLHFWIELTSDLKGYFVDYCLRMWFGNTNEIPHGVFNPMDYGELTYTGEVIDLPPLSNNLFRILITPFGQI